MDAYVETGPSAETEKRKWYRRIPPEVFIFFFYFLVTVLLTWPLIIRFTQSIYGFQSDNMGTLWELWWMKSFSHFGGHYTFCPLVGFPFGLHFSPIPMEPISIYSEFFMLKFFNEVIVYNLNIFFSFLLSGVTMYYLIRFMIRDRRVAFFGGFAYLICTNHAFNAMIFSHLAITQWMPLYILALLMFIKKPSWKTAVFLSGSGLLVALTCVHYGLYMAIFTPLFLIGRYVHKWIFLRRKAKLEGVPANRISFNRKTVALSLAVVLVLIAGITPFYNLSLKHMHVSGKWPTSPLPGELRIEQYIQWNSASPREYIMPSTYNPVLGTISEKLGASPASYGNSLYLGLVLVILALVCVFFPGRRKKRKTPVPLYAPEEPEHEQAQVVPAWKTDGNRHIIWGMVVVAVGCFVLSLKPYIYVGLTKIPMPSALILKLVPWYRWYLRISIVMVIAFIVLACFGLARILEKLNRPLKYILLVSLSAILAFEMLIIPPLRNVDFENTPRVYDKLASLPANAAIAFYPMREAGLFKTSMLQFYQRLFQKPMLNAAQDNSDGEALRRAAFNPYSSATPTILMRFNINYLVNFNEQPHTINTGQSTESLPGSLELVQSFKQKGEFSNADIYRIRAPKAALVPFYLGDITVPQLYVSDGKIVSARYMINKGIIRILNYSGRENIVDLKLPMTNIMLKRDISITGSNKTLWKVSLKSNEAAVADIRNLKIPKSGLDLSILVKGKAVRLTVNEIMLYGTTVATVKLGDVEILRH